MSRLGPHFAAKGCIRQSAVPGFGGRHKYSYEVLHIPMARTPWLILLIGSRVTKAQSLSSGTTACRLQCNEDIIMQCVRLTRLAHEIPFIFPRPETGNALKTRNQMHHGILDSSNLGSGLQSLLILQDPHLGLGAHDATTPLSPGLVVLVHEAVLDGRDELRQLVLVLGSHLGHGQDGSGLYSVSIAARIALPTSFKDRPSCGQRCPGAPCP